MASIDHRNIDQVDFLSDDFRGVVRRRFAEILGLGLLVLSVICSLALATWSVRRSELQSRHQCADPQSSRLARRGRIRSADPDFRSRLDRDRDPRRRLGLAADHASRRSTANGCVCILWIAAIVVRRRLRLLPAEKRRLAAADRPWRRDRRRAAESAGLYPRSDVGLEPHRPCRRDRHSRACSGRRRARFRLRTAPFAGGDHPPRGRGIRAGRRAHLHFARLDGAHIPQPESAALALYHPPHGRAQRGPPRRAHARSRRARHERAPPRDRRAGRRTKRTTKNTKTRTTSPRRARARPSRRKPRRFAVSAAAAMRCRSSRS